MLDPLFAHPATAPRLRSSPLGPWLDSFSTRLSGLGYTPGSCRSHVALAADLGRWMADQRVRTEALDESAIDAYVEQRKKQRSRRRVASLHLLAHLRAEGLVPPRPEVLDVSPVSCHCGRYAEHLRKDRGTARATVDCYVSLIRGFLCQRFGNGAVDLAALTASDIGDYLLGRARVLSPRSVGHLATVLRSFLRFLFAGGETTTDLSTAALTAQTRHLAGVPRYLPDADVEKLLETCDPDTLAGRRNRAILLLLVRLGIRAGEVAALELDDIRWRSGEIVVRGKGNVTDRLPLLHEVGEALVQYLATDRPQISSRGLFLTLYAPIRALGGPGAVSTIVRRGLERAGLHPPVRGSHLLRHSLGTRMIRAGASMAEIGEVLRHRSPGTAEVYAKVDFEMLRTIAQPWSVAGGVR